jgi:hypothetical protein
MVKRGYINQLAKFLRIEINHVNPSIGAKRTLRAKIENL